MSRAARISVALCVLAGVLEPALADASRPARTAEKHAIVIAANGGVDFPLRCVNIRVSTVATGWAAVRAVPGTTSINAMWCSHNGYVFHGASFLHKRGKVWRRVVAGTSVPKARCARVPVAVRADLAAYARLLHCH